VLTPLKSPRRSIHYLPDSRPAVSCVADREDQGGGALVNTPHCASVLLTALAQFAPVNRAYYPNRPGTIGFRRLR